MKKIICVLLFLFPFLLLATEFKDVIWHRCYDGDTCTYTINGVHPLLGDKIGVRLSGIDTPEIRGKCDIEKSRAKLVRDFVRDLHSQATTIELKNCERGKYFRLVCDVFLDGENLSEILIERGYARMYDGGKRESWCN